MKSVIQYIFGKPKFWSQLQTVVLSIIWWNLFFQLFITLQYLTMLGNDIEERTPKLLFLINDHITITILIISIFATISSVFEIFFFVNSFRKKSFLITFLLKLCSYLIGFALLSISIGLFHYSIEKGLGFIDSVKQIDNFIFNPIGLYFFIVGLFIKYTLDVFLGALKRTGLSLFFNSLFGKYKTPFEENRIFIFLDLVSSTKYSEKLGHKNYSAFLQECFLTISSSIVNNRGLIYQFVGDEVVISWNGDKKENYRRAINFYFQFCDDLKKKKKLFIEEYGLHPEFTASLNSGNVMVAEVGDLKTEIAYHGNVLNTASRLQKQCKKYGAGLLATEVFALNLAKTHHHYTYKYLDEVLLSGKVNSEKIFKIQREGQNDTISN